MAKFKINQAGMRKLQRQVKAGTDKATGEASRAAAQHDTPEAKAKAYADVLRRHGLEPNEAEIRRGFQD